MKKKNKKETSLSHRGEHIKAGVYLNLSEVLGSLKKD